MKKKKRPAQYRDKRRISKKSWVIIGLAWAMLAGTLIYLQLSSSAQSTSTAKVYVTPATGTFNRGSNFTVQVHVALNNDYNAALTHLYYDHTRMQYVSTSFNSAFNGPQNHAVVKNDGYGRFVEVGDNRTSSGPLRGTHRLATITFRATANGGVYARTGAGLVSLYPQHNYSLTYEWGSYTIRTPPTPTPPPPAPSIPTPSISSVSPSSFQGSNSARNLTINGQNFASNANVTLRDQRTNRTYANVPVTSRSSTRIVVRTTFAPATANWTAQVINANNRVSNQRQFRVTAPPAPAPTPTPTPRPTPTPAPPRRTPPRTVAPRPANPQPTIPRTSSPASPTNLRITDLAISQINYRSARLTWKTNKAATSVVTYGTSEDDLSHEQRGSGRTTNHSIVLNNSDSMRAGTKYFVKATSSDGGSPVSVTGSFDTKPIPITIYVTDTDEKPVSGAEVYAGDQTGITNEAGEIQANVPEGEILIIAQKDDLYREIDANVEIPSGSDAPMQRISLNLGELEAPVSAEQDRQQDSDGRSSSPLAIIIPVVVLLLLGVGLVIFLLKRRRARNQEYIGDALEAENYTTPLPPPPSVPEPTYQPLDSNVPHHTSLPELLGRYEPPAGTSVQADQSPAASVPTTDLPPAPQHTSLKDLVQAPPLDASPPPAEPLDDLPVSPVGEDTAPAQTPPETNNPSHTDDDETLTIEH